ncbi:tRNA pseudouridine(38-40) synthase TruA [bacterium SCSIO 12741]|nr:tRNA pseudouridine(38-40) synthase TruA [bacterium SCSIO 12741]
MKKNFQYLIHIRFLGFRFHGWSKQTGLKTVHSMVDKTVAFVLQHDSFKTLGSSRTDARVSAESFYVALYLDDALDNLNEFLDLLNLNFPTDIEAMELQEVSPDFNVIQSAKTKEYLYLFAPHCKGHPFSASLVTMIPDELDLDQMKAGAKLFKGTHNFQNYVTKPNEKTELVRTVSQSDIIPNRFYQSSFFPSEVFAFQLESSGFMRNQVRLMMGQLLELGKGHISLNDLADSLENKRSQPFKTIAPASGLILWKTYLIEFIQKP